MTKSQQEATRELERAQENWLRAYGWRREGVRWTHPRLDMPVGTFDAMIFTRAQPLIFGATRDMP